VSKKSTEPTFLSGHTLPGLGGLFEVAKEDGEEGGDGGGVILTGGDGAVRESGWIQLATPCKQKQISPLVFLANVPFVYSFPSMTQERGTRRDNNEVTLVKFAVHSDSLVLK
jgi:hypothetical protein